MDKESEQEKSAPAATEAERKFYADLAVKRQTGQLSVNQIRDIVGLEQLDDPAADMKLVTKTK